MTDKRHPTPLTDPFCGLSYQHACVRDLAWLLLTPNLFSHALDGYQAFSWQLDEARVGRWLTTLDRTLTREPQRYPSILRENHRRLGLYCEALLAFCVTEGWQDGAIDYQLIARNHQFSHQGATLGECDFILRSRSHQFVHVELALKFYLQHRAGVYEWDNWLGPNAVDCLELKMARLLEHQLPLLQHKGIQQALAQLLPHPVTARQVSSRHLIKGCVFTHISHPLYALPLHANRQALCGRWCFYREFKDYAKDQLFIDSKGQFCATLCEKPAWLSDADNQAHFSSVDQACQAMQNSAAPGTMLRTGSAQMTLQNCTLMVVPDYWPNTSPPSRKR